MAVIVRKLGELWARNQHLPKVDPQISKGWQRLLNEWAEDASLPLLVRKGSLVRGSELRHSSGRKVVPCDNSPAQWACYLALTGNVPTCAEIRKWFSNDLIPVSFANKKTEANLRRYHCTLGSYTVNKARWKLCHIEVVGLKARTPLTEVPIEMLREKFILLLSPTNHFLLPIAWGGLGETKEFLSGFMGA